nr:hypothetical protein CFP56_04112 [Quercus suber]
MKLSVAGSRGSIVMIPQALTFLPVSTSTSTYFARTSTSTPPTGHLYSTTMRSLHVCSRSAQFAFPTSTTQSDDVRFCPIALRSEGPVAAYGVKCSTSLLCRDDRRLVPTCTSIAAATAFAGLGRSKRGLQFVCVSGCMSPRLPRRLTGGLPNAVVLCGGDRHHAVPRTVKLAVTSWTSVVSLGPRTLLVWHEVGRAVLPPYKDQDSNILLSANYIPPVFRYYHSTNFSSLVSTSIIVPGELRHRSNYPILRMRFTILLGLLVSVAIAAPIGSPVESALRSRQTNNAGSTSTSTTNNGGLLNLGLNGGSASAAEDGQSTSSTSTSECGLFSCAGSASAAGPNGTAADAGDA